MTSHQQSLNRQLGKYLILPRNRLTRLAILAFMAGWIGGSVLTGLSLWGLLG